MPQMMARVRVKALMNGMGYRVYHAPGEETDGSRVVFVCAVWLCERSVVSEREARP